MEYFVDISWMSSQHIKYDTQMALAS